MSAMQIIRMLRGAQDPGPAFRLDRRSGSFTANSDTHVPHLSHSSLHHMLSRLAAAGTDLLKYGPSVLRYSVAAVKQHLASVPWLAACHPMLGFCSVM